MRQQNTSIGGIVDENIAWITKYKIIYRESLWWSLIEILSS